MRANAAAQIRCEFRATLVDYPSFEAEGGNQWHWLDGACARIAYVRTLSPAPIALSSIGRRGEMRGGRDSNDRAQIGCGYGSECHLLRYLGRHRQCLDKAQCDVIPADEVIWLDFPFDPRRTWPDHEWERI